MHELMQFKFLSGKVQFAWLNVAVTVNVKFCKYFAFIVGQRPEDCAPGRARLLAGFM